MLGDSMEGGRHPVFPGDTIITDKSADTEDGDLVVIQLSDGSRLCRMLKSDQYIATNILKSDPTPFTIDQSEAELDGKVIEVRHYLTDRTE